MMENILLFIVQINYIYILLYTYITMYLFVYMFIFIKGTIIMKSLILIGLQILLTNALYLCCSNIDGAGTPTIASTSCSSISSFDCKFEAEWIN